MSERTAEPPVIRQVVDAPDGHTCSWWQPAADGDGLEQCDDSATVLFVFEQSTNADDDRRNNAFGCADHGPHEPTIDTDADTDQQVATDGGNVHAGNINSIVREQYRVAEANGNLDDDLAERFNGGDA